MNILLSAVLGELTTRSINFLIKNSVKPTAPDVDDRLRRILLRAQVIVDEAMGRQITNRGILQQLDMLRDAMHHGYYIIDTFRYQSHSEEEAKGQVLSKSLSLLKVVNSLQGLYSSSRSTQIFEQLQKSLDDLSSVINDMEEIVVFLMSYPRIYRQPYSMHLLVGNCMFGRQMETELVISFLLHTQPHAPKELEVLPIVGPGKVGKTTLVAHVCEDARVRDHFSEILFLHGHDLTGVDLAALKERYVTEHRNHGSNSNKEGRRLLIVVELVGTLTEDVWNRLCSAYMRHVPSGSKIIVTSQSDEIIKFGTTRALSLKYLSHEAYWYFFKMVTFGSMDPEMHPKLARMAMEIAGMMNGCFISANMMGCLLRDNIDFHFWCKVLAFLRGTIKQHVSKFGGHPVDLIIEKKPAHLGRMFTPSEDFVLHSEYQRSSQEDVPKIRVQDVIYGSVKAQGKFEALGWRSRIPPYHSYVNVCEIRELKTMGTKRKRCMKNRVAL
ncbi:putative disease resistance protein RGA3 [Panicum virgatum]|nr:putative disease resistance protein RGA3 [Panicum virgatum]